MCVLIQILSVGRKSRKEIVQIAAQQIHPAKYSLQNLYMTFVRPAEPTMTNWSQEEYKTGERAVFLDSKPEEMAFPSFVRWLKDKGDLYCWDEQTLYAFTLAFHRHISENPRLIPRIGILSEMVCAKLGRKNAAHIHPAKLCRKVCGRFQRSPRKADDVLDAVRLLVRASRLDFSCVPLVTLDEYTEEVRRLANEQKKAKEQEQSVPVPQAANLLYSVRSHRKAVHRPGCPYLRRVSADRLAGFDNMGLAKDEGYHACLVCSPARKLFKTDISGLAHFCQVKELECVYHDDTIHIRSRYDFWRVVYDDEAGIFILLHKNTEPAHHRSEKTLVPGFHRQVCDATTLRGMLRYIARHDEYCDRDKVNQSAAKQREQAQTPKEAKKLKRRKKSRSVKRTIALIDELRASGRMRD